MKIVETEGYGRKLTAELLTVFTQQAQGLCPR
jgi:hypothetical protein